MDILEVPVTPQTDLFAAAANITNNIPLTAWQREVLQALMGVGANGKHYRPHELAKERQRAYRAIYDAREKAIRNILNAWQIMSPQEKYSAVFDPPEQPTVLVSRGPRPNTHTDTPVVDIAPKRQNLGELSRGQLLELAVSLGPRRTLTKDQVTALAQEGSFIAVSTVEETFGSWATFTSLCNQLRAQLRKHSA